MPEQFLRPDVRKIVRGVVGTLAAVSLIVFALIYLLTADPEGDPLPDEARPDRASIRQEVDGEANARLRSYSWVDKEKGIVRIPVERAAALWLAENNQ